MRSLAVAAFALLTVGGVAMVSGAAQADGVTVAKSRTVYAQSDAFYLATPGAEPFGGRLRPSRNLFSTYTSTAYDCGYYPVTRHRNGEVYVRWVRRCQLF